MKNTRGNYVVLNDNLVPVKEIPPKTGTEEKVAYEVIKIIDNAPLFLEGHFARLQTSTEKARIPLYKSKTEIARFITLLSQENQIDTGNVEILVSTNLFLIRFIPHFYPPLKLYEDGISVGFYYAERSNPNAKIKNRRLRESINKKLIKKQLYELILVSRQGNITEGSRSNVLFIGKDNKIYTAPESQILKGITREEVLKICKRLNFELVEKTITKKDLKNFDSAFITGTSPGILPIKSINNQRFSIENGILKKVMNEYQKAVKKAVSSEISS
jgi:branched-chain amino acid aminotransferase